MEKIRERVIQLIRENSSKLENTFGTITSRKQPDDINGLTKLEDVADSLEKIEIGLKLEEEYKMEIPDEDYDKFVTIDDLVKFVDTNKGV